MNIFDNEAVAQVLWARGFYDYLSLGDLSRLERTRSGPVTTYHPRSTQDILVKRAVAEKNWRALGRAPIFFRRNMSFVLQLIEINAWCYHYLHIHAKENQQIILAVIKKIPKITDIIYNSRICPAFFSNRDNIIEMVRSHANLLKFAVEFPTDVEIAQIALDGSVHAFRYVSFTIGENITIVNQVLSKQIEYMARLQYPVLINPSVMLTAVHKLTEKYGDVSDVKLPTPKEVRVNLVRLYGLKLTKMQELEELIIIIQKERYALNIIGTISSIESLLENIEYYTRVVFFYTFCKHVCSGFTFK